MKDDSLYVTYIGLALALALIVLVVGHLVLFLAYYADTLAPTTLPYVEEFAGVKRLDYRQFGGAWRLQDDALVQLDTQQPDLFAVLPNLSVAPDKSYLYQAKLRILAGPNGGGLFFNLQHPDSLPGSHLVRFGSGDGREYLVYGYFDEALTFVEQGAVSPPPPVTPEVELGVSVHGDSYDVLVNGQPVAQAVPLAYRGGHLALTSWFSSVAFDDVLVTGDLPATPAAVESAQPPVVDAAAAPADNPAPAEAAALAAPETNSQQLLPGAPVNAAAPADPFGVPGRLNSYFTGQFGADTDQSRWRILAGVWNFGADGLVETNGVDFDNAIVYVDPFSDLVLRAQFQHLQGAGGGVLFNIPLATTPKSGHLVRYMEPTVVAWGYFDDAGVFQGQGSANVPPAGSDLHTLTVTINATTYGVELDGVLLAGDIPVMRPQGRIGLTSSQSVVAFKSVEVTAVAPVP